MYLIYVLSCLVFKGRRNKESIVYWEQTLRDHIETVDFLLERCIKEGADQLQLQALFELLTYVCRSSHFSPEIQRNCRSFKVVRKELLAIKSSSTVGLFDGLFISGDVRYKIQVLEKKLKQCQSRFMVICHSG